MFGVDWSNPETLWLNLTNLGLGLIVIACLAFVAYGVLGDLKEKGKFTVRVRGVDREIKDFVNGAYEPHVLRTPELGVLMADGGEPVRDPGAPAKNPASGTPKPKRTGR